MMWKILTAQIREEIYDSLKNRELFTEEQIEGGVLVCNGQSDGLWNRNAEFKFINSFALLPLVFWLLNSLILV